MLGPAHCVPLGGHDPKDADVVFGGVLIAAGRS